MGILTSISTMMTVRAVGLKLNRSSCPIQDTAHLHNADRALSRRPMDGGPSPDSAANEYIAATNKGQEK